MHPSTDTRSRSSDDITIYIKATTISTSPSPFVSNIFDITPQKMFARSNKKYNKSDQKCENNKTK